MLIQKTNETSCNLKPPHVLLCIMNAHFDVNLTAVYRKLKSCLVTKVQPYLERYIMNTTDKWTNMLYPTNSNISNKQKHSKRGGIEATQQCLPDGTFKCILVKKIRISIKFSMTFVVGLKTRQLAVVKIGSLFPYCSVKLPVIEATPGLPLSQ